MGQGHVRDLMECTVEWDGPMHRYLAICLAYAADRKGIIRMSQVELAADMCVSVKTVARGMDALCDLEVVTRLGHGRYGLRFGLPKDGAAPMPHPKGAEAEQERLRKIVADQRASGEWTHGISYGSDGWPVLREMHKE